MKKRSSALICILLPMLVISIAVGIVYHNKKTESASNVETLAKPVAPRVVNIIDDTPGVEQTAVFQRSNYESDEPNLQNQVNAWLSQNHGKVEIIRVLQSQSGQHYYLVTITIFYKRTG